MCRCFRCRARARAVQGQGFWTTDMVDARSSYNWCVIMSEGRPDGRTSSYWNRVAANNWRYAKRHGYGFRYSRISENRCPHPQHGRRAAAWCKVPTRASAITRVPPR